MHEADRFLKQEVAPFVILHPQHVAEKIEPRRKPGSAHSKQRPALDAVHPFWVEQRRTHNRKPDKCALWRRCAVHAHCNEA